MGSATVTIDDKSFQTEVLDAKTPVLVDFWATWCQPCRALAPTLDELATSYQGKVKVAKLDVDVNNSTAEKYGIRALPTLLLFKDGKVIDQIVGSVARHKLEETVKKAL